MSALRRILVALLALGLFAAPGAAAGVRAAAEMAEAVEAAEQVVATPAARPAPPDRREATPQLLPPPFPSPTRSDRPGDRYPPVPRHVLLCVWRE